MRAMLLVATALAYETDQLTRRGEPLADVLKEANAAANVWLVEAMGRANTVTGCRAGEERARRVLASAIYAFTARNRYVPARGQLAGFGYGVFSAWLEQAPIARREFRARDDIYGELKPSESLVLGTVGVCSTISLGGVLMGTDKLDHFWEQGYEYYVESAYGKNDTRAKRWGVGTEKGPYGLLTSDVFSFADLYANWAGYRFYTGLLREGSVFRLDERGCVAQTRPFDWSEWVDDAMDEVYDPPVYDPHVAEHVDLHLDRERAEICAGYAVWGEEAARRRTAVLMRRSEWVHESAPAWVDEWDLEGLCAGSAVAGP
jgi:hypothetical protein